MKAILTIFLVLFTSTIYCQFIVNNKYRLWEVYQDNCDPQYNFTSYLMSDGDTIIGSDSCIKIRQDNWSIYNFIRETNGKVYLRTTSQDILIYDFKAAVGDTIHLYNINLIVGKTDTEFYAGQNRKRMLLFYEGCTFDSLNCEKWYEGIGSLCGLLNPGEYDLTGGQHSLICFSENDSLKYDNTYSGDCSPIPMNINNEISFGNITFQAYPNPANHKIYFSLYGNKNLDYRIEILNITGVLIDSFRIINNGNIEKNIEAYKSGIYFYKLYENCKLIKTDKIIIGQ